MKILKMVNKLSERPVFCKWLTYVTLIFNLKQQFARILEIAKIKYFI